jgi:hypothetical protein
MPRQLPLAVLVLLALLLTGLALNAGGRGTRGVAPSVRSARTSISSSPAHVDLSAADESIVGARHRARPRTFPPAAGTPAAARPFVLAANVRHPVPLSADRIAGVRDGLRAFASYSRAVLGTPISKPVTVVLAQRPRCLWPQAGAAGLAWGHTICLFAHDPRYTDNRVSGALIAAHEAAHVLLDAEAGCLRPGRRMPRWLIEGMAEDLAWRAVRPRADLASRRRRALAQARLDRDRHPRRLSYGDAELRVLNLELDRPRTLVSFCRSVDAGMAWPVAAQRAFGHAADFI